MNKSYIIFPTALLLLLLSACSKTPSSDTLSTGSAPSAVEIKTTALTNFKSLDRFKGKPPGDLIKDEVIGKEIRAVVPQSQFKCMDEIFNYMPDLELGSDGSVTASLNGSHADRFMEAFISIKPSGVVNIVLQCDPQKTPKGKYQFFTNEGIHTATPKAILDWMYSLGSDGDRVVKSNGKENVEMAFEDFVQTLSPVNKPLEVKIPATPAPTMQPEPVTTSASVDTSRPTLTAEPCWERVVKNADGSFLSIDPCRIENVSNEKKVWVSAVYHGTYSSTRQAVGESSPSNTYFDRVQYVAYYDCDRRTVWKGTTYGYRNKMLVDNYEPKYTPKEKIDPNTDEDVILKKVCNAAPAPTVQPALATTSTSANTSRPPQQSAVEIQACEHAKARCYQKSSGTMVQMCLNALRNMRGCN